MIKAKHRLEGLENDQLKGLFEKIKKLDPGNYNVYVTNGRSQRSLQQNAYYHGVVVKLISQHTGYSTNETHQQLKYLFNPELITIGDDVVVMPASTQKMNTAQFEEYLEQIRIWAATEMDLEIPLPNEVPEEQAILILNEDAA